MKLVSRKISPSPDRPDSFRVAADIEMERGGRILNFWFDLPNDCRSQLTESGNPWLILMVPMAIATGQDIELPHPVDPHLLENLQGMMRLWHDWHPELRPAHVDAPLLTEPARPGPRRGMFFSGGVDSVFSLLRHDKELIGCGSGLVDDLIFVAGLDIPISDTVEVEKAQEHLGRVATAHDKNLLRVSTNLKTLDCAYRDSWLLFYGCALGAIGHLLDGRYREIICTSEQCYTKGTLTGSHPITDALLSSRYLTFVHDGASFTRVEKTTAIAAAGNPLKLLRVCWESKRHDNCSRCSKCLRTMVTLDLAGYREQASCFDWSDYDVQKLRSTYLHNDGVTIFFREILAEAQRRGRDDIAAAVDQSIGCSLTTRRIVDWIRRIPVLWRFDYQIQRFLLHRAGQSSPPSSKRPFGEGLRPRRSARRECL